ncbi:MAG: excinuclease ABC subunit UvrA, partial [Sediminibacterium sp.]|nr:excinuclease ABC subunit UvrA [Sediminibacterium sp.]
IHNITKIRTVLKIDACVNITDMAYFQNQSIYILLDRLIVPETGFSEDDINRLSDSFKTALNWDTHNVIIDINEDSIMLFNNLLFLDGIQFEEPSINLFSFNNSFGACKNCEGTGIEHGIDIDLIIPNKLLTLYDGAIEPLREYKMETIKKTLFDELANFNISIYKPISEFTESEYDILLYGNNKFKGLYKTLKDLEFKNISGSRFYLFPYYNSVACTSCKGSRLKNEANYIKINNKNFGRVCNFTIELLHEWISSISLSQYEYKIAERIILEIKNRCSTLLQVGLGYLTLNRNAATLSGGESQRIQLTKNLNSNLTDTLYVLDEPSIGLHPRDTENLIKVLQNLKSLGNTVLIVEHDEQIMKKADYIIDMGPFAGRLGGKVVASGNAHEIMKNKDSLTGQFLKHNNKITLNKNPRKWTNKITIEKAHLHNLKNVTVDFPLQVLTVVTGVSGSGKSTLVKNVLYNALTAEKQFNYSDKNKKKYFEKISGDIKSIYFTELIDQNSIGRSTRSNPVTYIKVYDLIRDLFANQPLAKKNKFSANYFSFNVSGGRCETCLGEGEQIIEMQFLSDIQITCETCKGKRFKKEILEITYKNKNIDDVLHLTVDEALEYFKDNITIFNGLKPLQEVGLGYIQLGQSSNTLSGGEAQRIKLASYLNKGSNNNKVLFIFDEPTTGLHSYDIQFLVKSFNALIERGHSVIVIEHNIQLIQQADWIIDIGPEAGDLGGNIVYQGIPTGIKKIKESITATYL